MEDTESMMVVGVGTTLWVEQDDIVEGYPWSVIGDLRRPRSTFDEANYDVRDVLQPLFPEVMFDPESACFYAYTTDRLTALLLVEAVRVWMALHGRAVVETSAQ
jgi:hypothetical protein